MSPGLFAIVTIIGVLLLMFLLVKLRWHPVISLFLVAIYFGVALGNDLVTTFSMINKGLGSTLSAITITILFGAMTAMGIQDTGAVASIVNFFIKRFKGKRLELAPALTSFIMSIPVFGDITVVLTAPIASALVKRKKKMTMANTAMLAAVGTTLTHGIVPPTPGILAVTLLLGADLGLVVLVGTIISLIALFGVYFLLNKWASKTHIEPREDFVVGIEEAEESASVEDLCIKQKFPISSLQGFLPLLLPVILISSGTIANMVFPAESLVLAFFKVISDRAIAMFSGVVAAAIIGYKHKNQVIRNALINAGEISADAPENEIDMLVKKTPYILVVLSNWVIRACKISIMPLLITAMGGAMASIIQSAPVLEELAEMVVSWGISPILIPFVLGSLLLLACGSQTTAGMTAAGMLLPMIPVLGISPLMCTLAIGAGTLVFPYPNNSGFWVNSQFFNLDMKQMFKYVSFPSALAGIIAFLALIAISLTGLI